MKYLSPRALYGYLTTDYFAPTFLDIVEYKEELDSLMEEYRNVFGAKNISFFIEIASKELYEQEKSKALAGLFNSLFGPINTVIINLQNK